MRGSIHNSMRFSDLLRPLLPSSPPGKVIALVGGGGKTTAMFALAEEFSADGHDVLMTTTTHIADPRDEPDRSFDHLWLDPAAVADPAQIPKTAAGRGRRCVLAGSDAADAGKLKGIDPEQLTTLRHVWPFILVEADGAKRKPIKAPAAYEPVLPPTADLVLGLIGLDALGRACGTDTVHRPEHFSQITGCPPGTPIGLDHLARLATAPDGLFKQVPPATPRVLVLNKADRSPLPLPEVLDALEDSVSRCAELIVITTLAERDPEQRVHAQRPLVCCHFPGDLAS
ncbi:selenium cofactor biosynthesis protein YqeC [Propionivibrio dicarboxylicus]|uniref:Probable selenium-dependent hydroxylase accessory protein YqeC n=1 Tax=Propionivibrio dicarboxylicus TaxID=83767 RepID=A0A1G7WWP5_9RHOO|nr:selenium cofactor biosynthesis protein YqeC [Propionivibrio dicarboxylicus]SDG76345.1 probable selenium-dependent hydroxylase accessory protein YqeC [Propionivibrio dicarboxylicus]